MKTKVTRWRSLLKRYGGWAVPYVAVGMGVEAVNRRPRLKLMLAGVGVCGLAALWQTQMPKLPTNGYLPSPKTWQTMKTTAEPERGAKYKVVDLGTLGGNFAFPTAISNNGIVVGYAPNRNDELHSFLWKSGKIKDLGTLGGTFCIATDVNDNGQAVGLSTLADDERLHGFATQSGKLKDIGHLGGDLSIASGINQKGLVCGSSLTKDGYPKATLWRDGKMKVAFDLKDLPYTFGDAVNNQGFDPRDWLHRNRRAGVRTTRPE